MNYDFSRLNDNKNNDDDDDEGDTAISSGFVEANKVFVLHIVSVLLAYYYKLSEFIHMYSVHTRLWRLFGTLKPIYTALNNISVKLTSHICKIFILFSWC